MGNTNTWECNDKGRSVIAQAIKNLPGFVPGNGVYVSTSEITSKLKAFSAYIQDALPKLVVQVSSSLLGDLFTGMGKLIDCKLKPGSYLDSSVASWELVNLFEKNGFLFFTVKALGSGKVCEFPVDYFRPADQEGIKKKLAKWRALDAEMPNGGADDENKRIELEGRGGIKKQPKFLNFVAETEDDLAAIQNDLNMAGFNCRSILEEAWDIKCILPWRLLFERDRVRVAKTEAGFIYEVNDLANQIDGAYAKLVEIGESRICNWQLRNGLGQGGGGPETSRSL